MDALPLPLSEARAARAREALAATGGASLPDTSLEVSDSAEVEMAHSSEGGGLFFVAARQWMGDVGLFEGRRGERLTVARFLNRVLGLPLARQRLLLDYFAQALPSA
jgi:hypothetical protein